MTILRTEVMRRAKAVPLGSDWYSQSTLDPDGPNTGWRPDCSGWVSYCWDCPRSGPGTWGGYSTATFVTHGIMFEIPWGELKWGDAIGYCGPTTAGSGGGHICLFQNWVGSRIGLGATAHTLEHGSGWGPKDMNRTVPSNYKAYRFVDIEEADGTTYPGGIPSWENNMFCKKGDGGEDVYYLQLRGLALGGKLPQFGADKDWGNETSAMLVSLGLSGDVFDGQQAEKLDKLEYKKFGGAVPPDVLQAAIRAELAKAVALVPMRAPDQLKIQLG